MRCWRNSPKEDRLRVIYFSKNSVFMVKVWTQVLSKIWKISSCLLSTSGEILGEKKRHKAYVCCFLNIRKIGLLFWCSALVKTQFSSLYFTFLESVNSLQLEEYKVVIINKHFLFVSVGEFGVLSRKDLSLRGIIAPGSFTYLPICFHSVTGWSLDSTSCLWKCLLIQKSERLIVLLKNNDNKAPSFSAQENSYKIWVSYTINKTQ